MIPLSIVPIIQALYTFKGNYTNSGQTTSMAPATADWNSTRPNLYPVPRTPEISRGGPFRVALEVRLQNSGWATPVTNGMLFEIIYRDADGNFTTLGSGTVTASAATVGSFNPIPATDIEAGLIKAGGSIHTRVTVDAGAGNATDLNLNAIMTLYPKTS